jgi:hypothetical protein
MTNYEHAKELLTNFGIDFQPIGDHNLFAEITDKHIVHMLQNHELLSQFSWQATEDGWFITDFDGVRESLFADELFVEVMNRLA